MTPEDFSWISSLARYQCDAWSARGVAPAPPYRESISRSRRAMTSGSDASCISFSTTLLKPPSIWNAAASARRSIQNTPKRFSSGISSPGLIW